MGNRFVYIKENLFESTKLSSIQRNFFFHRISKKCLKIYKENDRAGQVKVKVYYWMANVSKTKHRLPLQGLSK